MPGTAVQITVEGKKIPEYQDPEILKSDISSFVLDLRRIGIRFETLYKLPDKVPKEKVNSIINMLKNIGALNQTTGNLTNDGFMLSSFRNFSPFISASILNLSRNYYDGEVTPMLLAALSLKLISDDIILNNLCPKFVQNFNYESDLDTIMKTFIEMVLKRRKITEIDPDFGFHPKNATQIVGEIFDLSETLDIGDTEDLWTNIDKFYQNCDFVHTFCQRLFDEIEKNSENGAWITARKAELDMISNTKLEPEFRFKADECHSFEETEKLDESNKFAEYIPSDDKEKQES
ncbi:hypothetical protein TVAG_128560 [Trichomonas vaginalis G3]|uniref:Uncharacterized protein n=1 Tax=Trichomonas vaginalis (strain ATCC PRA-98 / G3) TaxID=412133 RepID=A2H670_TRIV3|nr:helicase protein [Trichomonas vaginalis G3]EAX75097.1 hypothetical protein TVAG_128560 [Trichomonas vaginalis G3]KAI5483352.1 helicase protein [Trichomonas vaginalis G3]|eukprot:XP_001288027.1 hypothetical protein [Trichomonas vaginalis G3]